MSTLQEIKNLLLTVVDDVIYDFTGLVSVMEVINSTSDIILYKDVFKQIVEMKKLLEDTALQGDYKEPKTLKPPIDPTKEIQSLFAFMKQMHFCFWEITAKLRTIQLQLPSLQSKEQAIPTMRILKAFKNLLQPAIQKIVSMKSRETMDQDEIALSMPNLTLTEKQERILSSLHMLEGRLDVLENLHS